MNSILMLPAALAGVLVTLTGCKVVNPDIGGGKILLYSTKGEYIDAANVGNLPDMVTFINDKNLISANEGEPDNDYENDPNGSVSLIQLAANKRVQSVTTLDFSSVPLDGDVRIKPGSTAAADLEPEYIAVNEKGNTAWVSLQENNAVAIVDLKAKRITKVKALGAVEWNGLAVDIVDDGIANPIDTAPINIFALYQPDTLASYRVDGKDYFVSANEGDDREYDGWEDLEKVKDLELADGESALSAKLQDALLKTKMKKLRVLKDMGVDENGIYQQLFMTGTRSFSIWDADANLVFDSGAMIEQVLAADYAEVFNTRVDDTDDKDDIAELDDDGTSYSLIEDTAYFWEGVDARSLKKGAEPEALALAKIGKQTFAYVGLEKQGGFMVFNITDPQAVTLVQYFNDIDYSAAPAKAGDLAPEGSVTFEQGGKHYLAAANELSSTLAIYQLADNGMMNKLASIQVGTFGKGAAEIVAYARQALYVTNGEKKQIDIYNVADPAAPSLSTTIDISAHADSIQSLAVKDGVIAIAVE